MNKPHPTGAQGRSLLLMICTQALEATLPISTSWPYDRGTEVAVAKSCIIAIHRLGMREKHCWSNHF